MAQSNSDQQSPSLTSQRSAQRLHLLLFVDERSSKQRPTHQLLEYLDYLQTDQPFEIEVLDVGQHPDLAEHFRLIATPSLVRIHPKPTQVLAGGNLVDKLKRFWPQWQSEIQDVVSQPPSDEPNFQDDYPLGQIHLTEEIFRLKREKAELQDQLQFRNQILEMFVHDLRNPLTAASIAVETLQVVHNQPDSERFEALFPQLYRQARNQFKLMHRMISDILQATKGHSGSLQLQLQTVALAPLCQELLANFTARINAHHLTLIEDIPQDLPSVYGDAELLRQVLTNLLDNAIKYTPQGGQITVSLLHRTSQKVQVSVADTGLGIPPEKQDHIFEGHFRLKRDEEVEGYGIGLSLCRQVINAHYGSLWVDSVPQKGSCFHFTLPVYR